MTDQPVYAIGLMSGSSLDGIDAAIVRTDGERVGAIGLAVTRPYPPGLRERLRTVLGRERRDADVAAVEREMTLAHAEAVRDLLARENRRPADIALLGFHGHTLLHRPDDRRTWQIGDGRLLAAETGIDVVADFRTADVKAGGQGAPFAPAYHAALAAGLGKPLAVLNIGGVANVTWLGVGDGLLAFDTGPGNALLDDWMLRHTGQVADIDGALASAGTVDQAILASLLDNPYFYRPPPKSLNRDDFDPSIVERLSPQDGAATLTAFTAAAVAVGNRFFPQSPNRWLVCGGGRHNPAVMRALADRLAVPVEPVEAVGWEGDALEAQAFAYLAVRSARGMPISWPGTTGVSAPTHGGRIFRTHA